MATIYIDPGHGGSDPGAVGKKSLEKNLVLQISLMLGKILRDAGLIIHYTREGDTRLSESDRTDLSARAKVANQARADYFISLHCNANAGTPGAGIETYVYGRGGEAERLAKSVQASLVAATGLNNRGVKVENFAVIRETNMPAILVEMGFINNPLEEQLLIDRPELFAKAIATGVLEYVGIKGKEIETSDLTTDEAKSIVAERADLAAETIQYLYSYRWGDALVTKLAKAMLGDVSGILPLSGETPVDTARRTLRECAGLSDETIQFIWSYRWGDELLTKLAAAIA